MLFPDGAMGRSAKYSSSFHSDLGVLAPRAVRASSLRNSVGASRPRCFGRLLAFLSLMLTSCRFCFPIFATWMLIAAYNTFGTIRALHILPDAWGAVTMMM